MEVKITTGRKIHDRASRSVARLGVLLSLYLLLPCAQSFDFQLPRASERPAPEKIQEFLVRENDSIVYTLKLAYDLQGMPAYFFRNVFTPVCFTDVCKPVYIDVYWDLLGNYSRYEVPPDEPLTKVDHEPFDEKDYGQLHDILSNRSSILKDFTIHELVDTKTYNLSDSVDAVTGATPKTIKNEVIGGAVYTCYTLWRIVNGPVVEEMKKVTEKKSNDRLVKRFLKSENHHYQYWAIDKAIGKDGAIDRKFLPDLLRIIKGQNIFTARYTLERIPADLFSFSDTLQHWLWSAYTAGSYPLQMEILEKLEPITFSEELAMALCAALPNTNQEQFNLILKRLTAQENLSMQLILNLLDYLEHPMHSNDVDEALREIEGDHEVLKKKLKRFQRFKNKTSRN